MKFFTTMKDGGPESTVWGYFLAEIKTLFSIVLLRFENGSREAFHEHAFNCFSWVLKGELHEEMLDGGTIIHRASWWPFVTRRSTFHKVSSKGRSWVLSFRGPWKGTWREYLPNGVMQTLTHGRKVIS